jgi:hypothetical protein
MIDILVSDIGIYQCAEPRRTGSNIDVKSPVRGGNLSNMRMLEFNGCAIQSSQFDTQEQRSYVSSKWLVVVLA